jgi:hypothetical protein
VLSEAKIAIEKWLSPLDCFSPIFLRLLDIRQRFLVTLGRLNERARNEHHALRIDAIGHISASTEINRRSVGSQ